MRNRKLLLVLVVAILALVSGLLGTPSVKADAGDCCTDLQGQLCEPNPGSTTCNWGAYGPGYCQCYTRHWECYSFQSIPNPPDQPICAGG